MASAPHPKSRVGAGGVRWGGGLEGQGGGLPEFFCTDEPEAAANLPLRTSAKSPQESCAWLEKGKHKAKDIQTNAYEHMGMIIYITMNMHTNAS